MNALAIDTEGTTWNKGNPFDQRNFCVCYSYCLNGERSDAIKISDDSLQHLQQLIDSADVVILFNAKFDLHWLQNLKINFRGKRVWDGQLAEFILSNQTWKYPDLDTAAENRGLGRKLDVVRTEYWEKGINTPDIPWEEVLRPYAIKDAVLTYKLWVEQTKVLTGLKLKLFNLQCMDLLLLQEMEYNGLKYNPELCEKMAVELEEKSKKIKDQLDQIYPDIPINFNSSDQLSAFLYGGSITTESKEHIGFFKSGARAGQPKYKKVEVVHTLPRQYEPLKGSEMAKQGVYSTSEDTLLKLSGRKGTIQLLLEASKLEKLIGTYYRGLAKLNEEMNWSKGVLHAQYNQCVARTGRISSSKPNGQNMAGEVQVLFVTRYPSSDAAA